MQKLIDLIAGPILNHIRGTAKSYNGRCIWPFSQAVSPVAAIIKAHPDSAGGICEMLSAMYIERHAKDDHLAAWLKGGGKAIDANKIRYLMQLFVIGSNMRPGAMTENPTQGGGVNQTNATRRWLEAKGMKLRKSSLTLGGRVFTTDNIATRNRMGDRRRDFTATMAQELGDLGQGTGSYKFIGMWGPGGGHAMAAWVAEDATFFDPNFGEFWFENRADFVRWWPCFLHKCFYRNPYFGLSDRYEILDYSLKL